MSGTYPVGLYALKVPPGDIMIPGCPEFAAMFRVSMAAIDPSAEPDIQDADDKKPPRATLKVVRIRSDLMVDSSDEEDDEIDEDLLNGMEDEETSEDEEVNGGPSNHKTKKDNPLKITETESDDETSDDDEDIQDEEEEADAENVKNAQALLKKIMKGKDKAVDGDESDSDEDEEDESLGMEETVVCTLDPDKHYQQPLDIVVSEDERVFFKVTGTHTIHLTGNYVISLEDARTSLYDDEEEEEEYDLSPDEDELDELEEEDEESDELDELDDLEDPRITEVDSDEQEAPKLLEQLSKGKNKRPAEDSPEEDEDTGEALDDLIAKEVKTDETTSDEPKKLSKAEKKRLKKLKKNDGEAVSAPSSQPKDQKPEAKKEIPQVNGGSNEKKVQFAKNLEQGPTPSATKPETKSDQQQQQAKKPSTSLGIRDVQGITVDDRKVGQGRQAKKGDRVEMRYIGKLDNGKVFDANKSGKPFSFKLGTGEVIKGWDIGLAGITVGGERRLTIPAHLAYGKKGAPPDIPPNAKLVFDVKCLNIK